jgi:putative ABC transport system permease protein
MVHEIRSSGVLEALVSDLRFAGRMLAKSPVFTVVAVICIALGSGAVTTIFSTMNALVLRPLPGVPGASRLVRFERKTVDGSDGISASYSFYQYLRERSHTLDGVAAWGRAGSPTITLAVGSAEGLSVYGSLVSGNFFTVLGVRPALGRFFLPDEATAELIHPVLVVSHAFWRSRLGADSAAIGRTIAVNGTPFMLVGVAPPDFTGLDAPMRTDAYIPVTMLRQLRPRNAALQDPSAIWLRLFGRLKAGMSSEAAHRELAALTAARASDGTEPAWFKSFSDLRPSPLTGLPPDASTPLAGFLGLLLGAAGLVLLIASVNVASMLSARAILRRREMAVRTALEASRARLVRLLVAETLALFLLGACGAVLLAFPATRALEQLSIPGLTTPLALELSPDLRVLAFALLVSLCTGMVFGLAPALQATRTDIASRLRSDTAGSGARRTIMSNVLIVGQLALSLVLIVSAGLFLRALDTGYRVAPGFDPTGVAVAAFNPESWGYDETKGRAFFRSLREKVEGLPGVTTVSYAVRLPLTFQSTGLFIRLDGSAVQPDDRDVPVRVNAVDAGYFAVLRLPLVQGRAFGRNDDERAAKVAIVNETLARRYWPDRDAVGQTFRLQHDRITVVGVAQDAKYYHLTEKTPPFVYFPAAQQWEPAQILMVRTAGDPKQLASGVLDAVQALDRALPRPEVTTMQREMSIVLLPQRLAATVTGVLGSVGLLLATVGLYGITSYSTSRRTREIGVRVALGARQADILGMIVRGSLRLAGAGVLIGLLLAFAATRLIREFLFGLSPLDSFTFAAMSLLFVAVSLLASYVPARRAAAADPVAALRSE